uniref:Transposase InsH N-terminal domain-containing protein n=1 Tax=Rhodopseudomonas palustris (strain BisA53) TaxID=316055 RepID=Q07JG3_RHOP5
MGNDRDSDVVSNDGWCATSGGQRGSGGLFSYTRLEERIAAHHPMRAIRSQVDESPKVSSDRFKELLLAQGRPSVVPEYLAPATLLLTSVTVRSERQLMEHIDYNLLLPRWRVEIAFAFYGGLCPLSVQVEMNGPMMIKCGYWPPRSASGGRVEQQFEMLGCPGI